MQIFFQVPYNPYIIFLHVCCFFTLSFSLCLKLAFGGAVTTFAEFNNSCYSYFLNVSKTYCACKYKIPKLFYSYMEEKIISELFFSKNVNNIHSQQSFCTQVVLLYKHYIFLFLLLLLMYNLKIALKKSTTRKHPK